MQTMRRGGGTVGPWAGALLCCALGLAGSGVTGVGRADDEPRAADTSVAADTALAAPDDSAAGDATDALATGWKYRFEMTSPANDKFAITDRDFYLYFRPDTAAVHFQVRNRRGVAARILWDECSFIDTDGRQWKAVHRGIPYDRRDASQEPTWIQPNQTYADYLIPVDLLLDPSAASGGQVRELLPTDLRARAMVGKSFGCRLVLEYPNDNLRDTYDCSFKIASTFREDQ